MKILEKMMDQLALTSLYFHTTHLVSRGMTAVQIRLDINCSSEL